jgi:hypothetical protein
VTARTEAYRQDGYVAMPQILPREVATGFLARFTQDLAKMGIPLDRLNTPSPLLRQPAPEIHGTRYPPLATLHWGMTSAVIEVVGEPLLPTYAYFRLYRHGDTCKVHGDRGSCEHSLSLTLAYSDDQPWALEVSSARVDDPYLRTDDRFRPDEPHSGVAMEPGDAVLYQGVHHHHGRTTPNPNRWSAHLFMHWVARDGPYAQNAFDGQRPPERVTL